MLMNVAYHQVDHSQALDQFIQKKLRWVERHFPHPVKIRCAFERSGEKFKFLIHFRAPGRDDYVSVLSANPYISVSRAMKKLKDKLHQ